MDMDINSLVLTVSEFTSHFGFNIKLVILEFRTENEFTRNFRLPHVLVEL